MQWSRVIRLQIYPPNFPTIEWYHKSCMFYHSSLLPHNRTTTSICSALKPNFMLGVHLWSFSSHYWWRCSSSNIFLQKKCSKIVKKPSPPIYLHVPIEPPCMFHHYICFILYQSLVTWTLAKNSKNAHLEA